MTSTRKLCLDLFDAHRIGTIQDWFELNAASVQLLIYKIGKQ